MLSEFIFFWKDYKRRNRQGSFFRRNSPLFKGVFYILFAVLILILVLNLLYWLEQ